MGFKNKRILVLGAGGFIGSHLVKRLKKEGAMVLAADIKEPSFSSSHADEFFLGDLREINFCQKLFQYPVDYVFQLAADMGGAGYLFTGENDYAVMHNSALINLNISQLCIKKQVKKVFFSSSACIYPKHNQSDPLSPNCAEHSAIPADPDSEYGWEKLFSERIYLSALRNHNLDVKIARFHNVYGPEGAYDNGREKAPAAISRKVAMADHKGHITIWGDGKQTRSFLYIDDCLEGMLKLMESNFHGPYNIGSEDLVSIEDLSLLLIKLAGKSLSIKYEEGPIGVRGRNSDNTIIKRDLNWQPKVNLAEGLNQTYSWIAKQISEKKAIAQ